jgi:ureidoglycolate dehydrogenase (NAD+)
MMADDIWQLMKNKLIQLGLSDNDAQLISDCLIQTSLRGTDTHGIRLFATYCLKFENGRANKRPNMQFERDTPLSSILDADNANNANGIVAGRYAMQQAIDKAKALGLAMVVVKNSNHFAAANFTRLACEQNCIGLSMSMSNSDALVALQGGEQPFLGTNPIAFSVPGEQGQSFDLDFATSQVAYSKVMAYLATGQDLPQGWAIDAQGQDSSLGQTGEQSVQALKPLGGYKGQGLGLMVQMLTSVLS